MKKTKMKSNVFKSLEVKIILIVLVVLAILGLGYFLTTGVGKAIDTPQPEPVDFDLLPSNSEILVFTLVDTVDFSVTTSNKIKNDYKLYMVNETKELGLYQYSIYDKGDDNIVAQGLLGQDHTNSGFIYLDSDAKPDITLVYSADSMQIINHNYVIPTLAKVSVYKDGTLLETNLLTQSSDSTFENVFNITSNKATSAAAAMQGATGFAFTPMATGPTFSQYKFTWSPTVPDAYPLTITSTVDGIDETSEFVISVDDVIYKLDEVGMPKILIRKEQANIFEVEYIFEGTTNLQPFSLPCGSEGPLSDFNPDLVSQILTHDAGEDIETWKPGDVPADFENLVNNEGYLLKLKSGVQGFAFNVTCVEKFDPLNPGIVPIFSIPTLITGWNLVGVGGYQDVDIATLTPYLPAYKQISQVVELRTDGNEIIGVTKMKPGRAYWVFIQ